MKDGDIYFWWWKTPSDSHFINHHCWSMKAEANNGKLYDTYWSDRSKQLDLEKVEIKHQGNFHEMTKILQPAYYRSEDIVDMRHANASQAPIYLKAGAKRDPEIMRELAKNEINISESAIRLAKNRIEQLHEAITLIDTGELDSIHIPVSR